MGDHVNLPFSGASGKLVSGRGTVTWINVAETSGAAAAAVQLFDGSDTGGVPMGYFQLVEGTTLALSLGRGSLTFRRGLYVSVVSGTVKGGFAASLIPSDAEWAQLESQLDSGN
jgi:hypothetical protein